MPLEILNARQALRDLIDSYAYLGDDKKIHEQMGLFTRDAIYKVYMNNFLVSEVSGTENLEKEFNGHASQVKTYFTLNGQHTVKIDGDNATGTSFSQIKMVRESEGKNIISDYSVKYEDRYVCIDGNWFIKERTGYFIIVEVKPLNS